MMHLPTMQTPSLEAHVHQLAQINYVNYIILPTTLRMPDQQP